MRALRFLSVAVLLAACASSGTDSTGDTDAGSTTAPAVAEGGTIFLLQDSGSSPDRAGPFLYAVERAGAVTLEQRVAALTTVTSAEAADGITTAVPTDTVVNSVAVDGDTATIDLSAAFAGGGGTFSMSARLAQLVHTVIDAPDWINDIVLLLDGEQVTTFSSEGLELTQPLTLAGTEAVQGGILVAVPGAYTTVSTVVSVQGVADTLDGTINIDIVGPDDAVVASLGRVRTDNPTGWGDFAISLTLPKLTDGEILRIHTWEDSPTDGTPIYERFIPLTYSAS